MKRILSTLFVAFAVFAASAARVDTVTVATGNLSTAMTVLVVVPDDVQSDRRLPVAYVLHGYAGNQNDWLSHQPRIKDMADRYGMIIVNPDGRDSWYMDSFENPGMQMESFFINDLIPFIDKNYPTIPEPSKRAVTGLSMGGHGALYLAFRHPDVFGNAGSMSGGVDIRPFPGNWNLNNALGTMETHPERWEAAAVVNLVKNIRPGQVNIYFDCGVDDFFAGVNDNLHRVLLEAGIPHDYVSRPGAHTWEYWNNSILHHLLFFSEAFNR
jgi:S-formylglutathione hydrolase FrmB